MVLAVPGPLGGGVGLRAVPGGVPMPAAAEFCDAEISGIAESSLAVSSGGVGSKPTMFSARRPTRAASSAVMSSGVARPD